MILAITPFLARIGGKEAYFIDLINVMKKNGLSFIAASPYVESSLGLKIPSIRIPSRFIEPSAKDFQFPNLLWLKRIIDGFKPRILIVNDMYNGIVFSGILPENMFKIVVNHTTVMFSNPLSKILGAAYMNLMKSMTKLYDVSVIVSKDLVKEVSSKPVYIPPGINTLKIERKIMRLLRETSLPSGRYVFSWGRLVPFKGFHRLSLLKKELGVEVIVAGRYSDQVYYRKLVESGVKVIVNPSFEEILRYALGAELLIFPSLHEGTSISVLEAMCLGRFGKPVMGSKVGGIPDELGHEKLLFSTDDELVSKAKYLLENRDEGKRLAYNLWLRVKKHFSLKRFEERWMRLLRIALK